MLIYWMKNQLQKAFRTWSQQHYKSIQGEQDTKLQQTIDKRRAMAHLGDDNAAKQAAELQSLSANLDKATADKNKIN